MKVKTDLLVILFVLLLSVFYFNVTLNSPIVFGDEGYYAKHARNVIDNGMLPVEDTLATEIYHRAFIKPPFFILIESSFLLIGGEFAIKILIPIFAMLGSLMLYFFGKKYYNERVGFAAAVLFFIAPNLITHGVFNYVDSLFALLFIGALYFGYKAMKEDDKKNYILTGVFIGFAVLTKTSSAVLGFVFLIYLLVKKFEGWKKIVFIFIVAGIIVAPWILRNLIVFSDICYGPLVLDTQACKGQIDVQIEKIEGLEFEGRIAPAGTEVKLLEFGFINFIGFAFGLMGFVLFLFGIGILFTERKDIDLFIIISLISMIFIFSQSGALLRTEDTARFLVPATIGISLIGARFIETLYEYLRKYNRIVAIGFFVIFVLYSYYLGYEKLNSLIPVKEFSKGFIEGCKWVTENVPKDSLFYSKYAHQTNYLCDVTGSTKLPDQEEIQLTNNDIAYEHLKLHGFEYVFVQGFAVSREKYAATITLDFLAYLDNSTKFTKVFDNTNIYGNGGVILYEVL